MENDISREFQTLKTKLDKLNDAIRSLNSNVSDTNSGIGSLAGSVDRYSDNVNQFNQSVAQNFDDQNQRFTAGLDALKEVLQSGFELINSYEDNFSKFRDKFKEDLAEDIKDFQVSNSSLLTNVTTGIALTELLKSAFVSDESETAIKRSIEEHNERQILVRSSIEEKKQLFDKHIEHVFVSFFKQFKQVSNHILDLQYKVFERLNSKAEIKDEAMNNIQKADILRTELRQKKFSKISEDMKAEAFSDFNKLRREIERELSVSNIFNITVESSKEVPILSLPIETVETGKWNNESNRYLDLYGISDETNSCYDKENDLQEFERFNTYKESLRKSEYDFIEIEENELEGIKSGLQELQTEGIINKIHYELILKHLNTYKLSKMLRRV